MEGKYVEEARGGPAAARRLRPRIAKLDTTQEAFGIPPGNTTVGASSG